MEEKEAQPIHMLIACKLSDLNSRKGWDVGWNSDFFQVEHIPVDNKERG